MPGPSLRRIGIAAAVALCAGLATVGVLQGPSPDPVVRWAEWIALVGLVVAAMAGVGALVALRLAGWRNPESERDFGHDPELLRDQVTRTVRHELAHHVGFDEMGVRGLGL